MCDPGADPFIARVFHDCIYTTRDAVGFGVGLLSIAFWLVAQVPQFVLNIKNKSVEALSSWFLAQWLLGDTCNLVGCLLTNSQLPTQTWTASYFILADMVMLVQYIYYGALQRQLERVERRRILRQQRHLHYMHSHSGSDAPSAAALNQSSDEEAGLVGDGSNGHLQAGNARSAAALSKHRGIVTRTLAGIAVVALIQHQLVWGWGSGLAVSSRRRLLFSNPLRQEPPVWARTAGVFLGWTSSGFYLSSRVSQVYKNWSRKCTEGLSLAMFMCAISANITYGLGILIRSYSYHDLSESAPWLLGSLGVVALDCVISLQGCYYPAVDAKAAQRLRAPLLVTTPANRGAHASLQHSERQQ